MTLKIIVVVLIGYFLGNVQFGIIIAQRFGLQDIRKVGSGGTGATNVLRSVGIGPSALTLLCDAAKAIVAGLIGMLIFAGELRLYGAMLGGILAIVGHNWPVLYGFRGGKGVAASFGAVTVVAPFIGLLAILVFALLVLIFRIVSIASMVVAFGAAVALIVFNWGDPYFLLFGLAIFFMILYSHRENIKRLKNGTEKTISFSSKK